MCAAQISSTLTRRIALVVVEGHSHNDTPAPMAPSKLQLCTLGLPYKLLAALLCAGQALCLAKAVYYVWENHTVILLVPGAR